MERKKNLTVKYLPPFLYIIYSVGIVGHLIPVFRNLMISLTPYVLLLTGGLLVYTLSRRNSKIILWFILTYILTFLFEVTGVKTGFIFGEYHYGSPLGTKVFGVPLIIGLNWILVILGAKVFAEKFAGNVIFSSSIAAVLAVLFDYILEPVAVNLDYWTWAGNNIPVKNYIAWFFISFIFSLLYSRMKIKISSNLPVHYFLMQFIFFVIINLSV